MTESRALEKYRNLGGMALFFLLYMIAFICLERRDVELHLIHTAADELIPFCAYFILPYVSWYAYVALTVIWFAIQPERQEEYRKLAATICLGSIIFLFISFVYPNGHDLRPQLGRGWMVRPAGQAALFSGYADQYPAQPSCVPCGSLLHGDLEDTNRQASDSNQRDDLDAHGPDHPVHDVVEAAYRHRRPAGAAVQCRLLLVVLYHHSSVTRTSGTASPDALEQKKNRQSTCTEDMICPAGKEDKDVVL